MPLRAEFIGKEVTLKGSEIKGTIIDETKNSFIIETSKGKKTILKSKKTFQIRAKDTTITFEGDQIRQRPEDRIKLKPWK